MPNKYEQQPMKTPRVPDTESPSRESQPMEVPFREHEEEFVSDPNVPRRTGPEGRR